MRISAYLTMATFCSLAFYSLAIGTATAQVQLNPSGQVQLESAAPAWQGILAAQAKGTTRSDKRQFVFQCKS